jgi:putative transposase
MRTIKLEKGKYYHIYNRGANRQSIFFADENYRFLLRKVEHYTIQTRITVIAYCLMPNHFHFLFRQDGEISISDCMQKIFNGYTKAINKMYNRTGTLFESPFKAKVIETEEYAIHLCRYIHRNPVEAKLVTQPDFWEFSNYAEWIGKRKESLKDEMFITAHFKTADDYINFVLNYKGKQKYIFEF